jgi:hypothetical protein
VWSRAEENSGRLHVGQIGGTTLSSQRLQGPHRKSAASFWFARTLAKSLFQFVQAGPLVSP